MGMLLKSENKEILYYVIIPFFLHSNFLKNNTGKI